MSRDLIGSEVAVATALEKIELAARRAAEDCYSLNTYMERFANEIQRILKEMRE